MFRWLVFFATLPCAAFAQIPTIDRMESENLTPGKSATLTVFGKGLKNVERLWTPMATFAYQPADQPNETLAQFTGKLPEETRPGIHEARIVTTQGVSERRLLVVDELPSFKLSDVCEANPPTTTLPMACCVNGQINALKPKFFGLDLKKGQSVHIEVLARRLDSLLDPVLRISGSDGNEVSWVDDSPGLTGDAEITFMAPADDRYTVQLRDVQFGGGAAHFFHLRIGGQKLSDAPVRDNSLAAIGMVSESGVEEQEPNDVQSQATPVAAKASLLTGRFDNGDPADWYRISGEAQQSLCITAYTGRLNAPTDVVLNLLDSTGKNLTTADDTGSLDAQIALTLPTDGDYFLKVTELSGQSGSAWSYVLQIDRGGRIEAATAVDSVAVPKSGTASIPIAVRQVGRSASFEILATNLPPGITSTPVTVGPKQKSAVITLQSTSEAADVFQHPVQLQVRAMPDGRSVPVLFVPAAKPVTDAGYRVPRLQTGMFVYATGPAQYSLSAEPMTVNLSKGAETTVTVTAVRTGDWTQPIAIASTTPAAELPTGITIGSATLEKDTAQVAIKADDSAVPGRYSVSLQGTLTKDKTTIVQPVSTITLEIVEAVRAVDQEAVSK
ncbi:MAG: pre-peptidase C-terminal domain-containing protein [Planctomycetaceae bacterium]